MAEKISNLPPTVTAVATDAHEVNQGGVSKQEPNSQIATLFETLMTKLTPTGANFAINANGSVSFAVGTVTIATDGTVTIGPATGVDGGIVLRPDGSASFAGVAEPNIELSADGAVSVPAAVSCDNLVVGSGPGAIINNNGSAGFGNFSGDYAVNISATGSVAIGGPTIGSLYILNDAATQIIYGTTDDGVWYANGFAASGQEGITTNVVIPTVGTLHFTGGILTSVT